MLYSQVFSYCLIKSLIYLLLTSQVISFDGSSTVSEFSYRAAVQSKIRHQTTSGFALYVNDPLLSGVVSEHYVEPTAKVRLLVAASPNALNQSNGGTRTPWVTRRCSKGYTNFFRDEILT